MEIRKEFKEIKTVLLEKKGIDFYQEEQSDVGNYRVRLEFTDKKGNDVVADFGGYDRYIFDGKKKVGVKRNTLAFDGTRYEDKKNSGYAYNPETVDVNVYDYEYTKKDLIRFINDVTGESYTNIEFVG